MPCKLAAAYPRCVLRRLVARAPEKFANKQPCSCIPFSGSWAVLRGAKHCAHQHPGFARDAKQGPGILAKMLGYPPLRLLPSLRSFAQKECGPGRGSRGLFAPASASRLPRPFCALRVPTCAGAPAPARVRSGAARPPPLRGPDPAHSAQVGPAPRPLRPPLSRPALVRATRSAVGAAPAVPAASVSGRLRASYRSPLRPAPLPWFLAWGAASSRGRPLRGFGGGLAPAPGRGPPLAGLFSACGPGRGCARAAPACCRARFCPASFVPLLGRGFSPAPLPSPPPPLGAPGSAWLFQRACGPPTALRRQAPPGCLRLPIIPGCQGQAPLGWLRQP